MNILKFDNEIPCTDASRTTEWVDINLIRVDTNYQRPLCEKQVRDLVSSKDEGHMPVLSLRDDGFYYTCDGNHSTEARARRGDTQVLADVRRGLSPQDEARLFTILNQKRGQTSAQKFKARLVAKEPTAVAIEIEVRRHGLEIKDLGAIVGAERLYKQGFLSKVLEVVNAAWPNDKKRLEDGILRAFLAFFKLAKEKKFVVDIERLQKKMSEVTPKDVYRHNAKEYEQGALYIVGKYNSQLPALSTKRFPK